MSEPLSRSDLSAVADTASSITAWLRNASKAADVIEAAQAAQCNLDAAERGLAAVRDEHARALAEAEAARAAFVAEIAELRREADGVKAVIAAAKEEAARIVAQAHAAAADVAQAAAQERARVLAEAQEAVAAIERAGADAQLQTEAYRAEAEAARQNTEQALAALAAAQARVRQFAGA